MEERSLSQAMPAWETAGCLTAQAPLVWGIAGQLIPQALLTWETAGRSISRAPLAWGMAGQLIPQSPLASGDMCRASFSARAMDWPG